jgi:hypothetical protein
MSASRRAFAHGWYGRTWFGGSTIADASSRFEGPAGFGRPAALPPLPDIGELVREG